MKKYVQAGISCVVTILSLSAGWWFAELFFKDLEIESQYYDSIAIDIQNNNRPERLIVVKEMMSDGKITWSEWRNYNQRCEKERVKINRSELQGLIDQTKTKD